MGLGRWFQKLSLRTQSGIVICCLMLVVTAGIGFAGIREWRARSLSLIQNNLAQLSITMADRLGRVIQSRTREVQFVAELESLATVWIDPDRARIAVERMREGTEYAWVGFADTAGKILAGTDGIRESESVADQAWFQQGLIGASLEDRGLIRSIAKSSDGARLRFIPFLAISVPVYSGDGLLVGVLAAALDWSWATELRDSTLVADVHRSTEVLILRRDGIQLLGPNPGQPVLTRSEVERVHRKDRGILTRDDAIMSYAPLGGRQGAQLGWIILARQPVSVASTPVEEMTKTVVVLVIMIGLLSFAAALVAADRLSKPLRQLAIEADQIGRCTEYSTLSMRSGSLELEQLTSSLRSLLRRIDLERHRRATIEEDALEQAAKMDANLRSLKRLADTDHLTGLSNRRAFMAIAGGNFRKYMDEEYPFYIMNIDIDHFKRVNDTWGHAEGDIALQTVARTIVENIRQGDSAARFGGEEFIVLLPDATGRSAKRLSERLRCAIRSVCILPDGRALTASIGVAAVLPGDIDVEQVIARADGELYRAKMEGRDRVCIYRPTKAERHMSHLKRDICRLHS